MKNHQQLSRLSSIAALAIFLVTVSTVSAITITPTGTTFGSLPAATFGGSGIPNDSVEITTIGNLTLGLTATQRFANPAVTNDGAGTFFAGAGGDTLNGAPAYGQWNFDFYIKGLGQSQFVKLYYDNNAAVGNDVSSFFPTAVDGQDSWNLGMGFLNGGIFNPNTSGEYGFALVAYQNGVPSDTSGESLLAPREIGRTSILVKVGSPSVPDASGTVLLLGSALAGLALVRRRFVK